MILDFNYTPEYKTTNDDIADTPIKKCPNDFLGYLNIVFNYLRLLGFATTSNQYSSDFLHKTKDYYAALKTLNQQPSVGVINDLMKELEHLSNETIQESKKRKLTDLINIGYQLLFKKFMTSM